MSSVSIRRFGSTSLHHFHGSASSHYHHLHQQQHLPVSVCRGCGFSTRLQTLFDRHRRHCKRSASSSAGVTSGKVESGVSSENNRPGSGRELLPAPTVCRNYKCAKCSFVTNRAKLFLYHQNCIHGENINVYGCDHCDYASRHKNKVLRHKRLVHKVWSALSSADDKSLTSIPPTNGDKPAETDAATVVPTSDDNCPMNLSTQLRDDQEKLDETLASDAVEVSSKDVLNLTANVNDRFDSNNKDSGNDEVAIEEDQVVIVEDEDLQCENITSAEVQDLVMAPVRSVSDVIARTDAIVLPAGVTTQGGGNVFRCRYCRYTNRHKWKMASHVRSSHAAGRAIYRCPDCPKFATDSRVEWSAHRSRHTGKVMFECPECAYSTTMKRNYERHLERHRAGGPRRCGLCSYSSTGEGAIQRHMAEYHPPSPQKDVNVAVSTASAVILTTTTSPEEVPVQNAAAVDNDFFIVTNRHSPIQSDVLIGGVSDASVPMAINSPGMVSLTSLLQTTTRASQVLASTPVVATAAPMRPTFSSSKLPVPPSSVANGRCTCPICPLSYKRPADLNRHMKQKHETTLKDFVVHNEFGLPSSNLPSGGELHDSAGNDSSSPFPDDGSRASPDIPLNLSLKDTSDVRPSPLQILADEAVNLSSYGPPPAIGQEQAEPLDLSGIKTMKTIAPGTTTSSSQNLKPAAVGHGPSTQTGLPLVRTPAGFPCSRCSYVSKRASDLRRHQLVHTSNSKRYRCPHCPVDRSYKLQFDLGRHMARAHGNLVGTASTAAGQRPSANASTTLPASSGILQSTTTPVVTGIKLEPFVAVRQQTTETATSTSTGTKNHLACPYCQYVGKSVAELERHARLHSGEKPYRCLFCEFCTIWKSDMKIHLQKLHDTQVADYAGGIDALLDQICRSSDSTDAAAVDDLFVGGENVGRRQSQIKDTVVDYNMNVETSSCNNKNVYGSPSIPVQNGKGFKTDVNGKFSLSQVSSAPQPLNSIESPVQAEGKIKTFSSKSFACVRCDLKFISKSDARNHVVLQHSEICDPDSIIVVHQTDNLKLSGCAFNLSTANKHAKHPGMQSTKWQPATAQRRQLHVINAHESVEFGGNGKSHEQQRDLVKNDLQFTTVTDRVDDQLTVPGQQFVAVTAADKRVTSISLINSSSAAKVKGRYRPYKCSYCGKRSNWRWDLKKHIRRRHPFADVIVMSDSEARESFHEIEAQFQLQQQQQKKLDPVPCGYNTVGVSVIINNNTTTATVPVTSAGERTKEATLLEQTDVQRMTSSPSVALDDRLFGCSACNYRSSSNADLLKHIREFHPAPRLFGATRPQQTFPPKSSLSSSPSSQSVNGVASSKIASEDDVRLYTVDRQKLKRLCCSACPYRSNFRSDVGRHIRYKHPGIGARCEVMSTSEAASTLAEYLNTWALKKFVPSPVKTETESGQLVDGQILPESLNAADGYANVENCSKRANLPLNFDGQEFEVEQEDENLPWKCAVCEFTDPGKQAVVEHWQTAHCSIPLKSAMCTDDDAHRPDTKGEPEKENSSGNNKPCSDSDYAVRQDLQVVKVSASKMHRCDVCPYRTNKAGMLFIHKTYHQAQSDNSYKCPHCPYYVSTPRLLYQHVRVHGTQGANSAEGTITNSSGSTSTNHSNNTNNNNTSGKVGALSLSGNDRMSLIKLRSSLSTTAAVFGRARYPCASCPYVGYNRTDYIYHRQFHRSRPSAPYKCDLCPYWVGQPRLLTQHSKVHNPAYMQRHQFLEALTSTHTDSSSITPTGNEVSVDGVKAEKVTLQALGGPVEEEEIQTEMGFHKQNDSADVADVSGAESNGIRLSTETVNLLCSTAAGNVARRIVHRTIWHCDRCPYATAKRSQLETHRHLHGSAQRHTCDKCDYSVSGVHLLLQHVRLHNDEKQTPAAAADGNGVGDQKRITKETCEQGDSSSAEQQGLHQQQLPLQLNPKPVTADFGSSPAVSSATSAVTAAAVRTVYRCDKCPYSNARRDLLLCHARFHSGAGPLLCPRCDYSVSKVHLLTQHLRVHKQEIENTATASNRSSTEDGLLSKSASSTSQSKTTDVAADNNLTDGSELCNGLAELPVCEEQKADFMRKLCLKLVS